MIPQQQHLADWTKTVKINGKEVKALLDTGCTKTLVHSRCVAQTDYLGWKIPYHTASDKEIYFPAAQVVLEVVDKTTTIPVGVSENMNEDMLKGGTIPFSSEI